MASGTKKKTFNKIVLAYSGGLDTSIIIPWLKETYHGCEVIAVSRRRRAGHRAGRAGGKGNQDRRLQALYGGSDARNSSTTTSSPPSRPARSTRATTCWARRSRARSSPSASSRSRASRGRGRHLPRLHRQGQRSGAVRTDNQGVCAGYGDHRALARLGHQVQRRGDRLRRSRTRSR